MEKPIASTWQWTTWRVLNSFFEEPKSQEASKCYAARLLADNRWAAGNRNLHKRANWLQLGIDILETDLGFKYCFACVGNGGTGFWLRG